MPAESYFLVRHVPAPPSEAAAVIARLLEQGRRPIIGEIATGFYLRKPPPASWRYENTPVDEHRALAVYHPPGSGLADLSAASRLGFTTQMPRLHSVAVLAKPAAPLVFPIGPPLRYVMRHNPRRAKLSWHEVSLLEACWSYPYWKPQESFIRRALRDVEHLLRHSGGSLVIRRKALRWAAETEPDRGDVTPTLAGFLEAVRRLCRWLPRKPSILRHPLDAEDVQAA